MTLRCCAAALLALAAPSLAAQELSVETVSVDAADPVPPGSAVTVNFSVRNDGPGDVEDLAVSLLLSADGEAEGAALLAQTDDLDVEAGEAEDADVEVTIPSGTAPGCYTVLVVADPENSIAEADESDNQAGAELAVGAPCEPLPDLRPEDAVLSRASVPRGGDFTVEVTIVNDGPGTFEFALIGVVLSEDDVFDTDPGGPYDVEAGFGATWDIAPGGSQRVTIPAEVPLNIAAGDYTLFVAVDEGIGGSGVPETDETNNVLALPFTVEAGFEGPLPDLVLESVDVPGQPLIPGDWLTIYAMAASTEAPQPENVYSEAFLSPDSAISEDDLPLGGPLGYAGLTCGNDDCTYQVGRGALLPATVAEGDYFVIVAAWHDDPDADSTDNVLAVPVAVAPPPLQIVVDSSSVPTVPAGGGPVAVAATARAGIEPIVFSWYAILESPDGSEMGVAFQNDLELEPGEEAVLQTAFVISGEDPAGEYALTFYSEQAGAARLEWGEALITKAAGTDAETGDEAKTALGTAMPNPATGWSRVAYQTATAGPVRLSVLDALGREVAVLADGPVPAGPHAVRFDAAALPAGLYLLRLRADGVSLVSRFTVVR